MHMYIFGRAGCITLLLPGMSIGVLKVVNSHRAMKARFDGCHRLGVILGYKYGSGD